MAGYLHEFEALWAAWCARDFAALRQLFAAAGGVDGAIADDGETFVHRAIRDGDAGMLGFLLDLGCPRALASFDYLAYTPLHAAAAAGDAGMVQQLVAAGAEVDSHCEERIGNTAIREAVYGGHPEVVAILLRAGADPTIPGWMGLSAVDEAFNEVKGGLDGAAVTAIRRLLARFPSSLRDRRGAD